MKVYVVANAKGGVGKTTTSLALASILRSKGYKVLIIDTDLQQNTTNGYNAEPDGVATLYDVMISDERVSIEQAIQKCERGDIIASDELLKRADEVLKNEVDGNYRLQDAMEKLEGYDYVVIDTPPRLDTVSINCLACADEVIIPVICDKYSIEGLTKFYENLMAIKKRLNPKIKIAGLLRVQTQRAYTPFKEISPVLEEFAKKMGTKLFEANIRHCVDVTKAQGEDIDILDFNKRGNATKDYIEFVEELLEEGKSKKK